MESLVTWFTSTLGAHISREAIVFIISLFPILELRGEGYGYQEIADKLGYKTHSAVIKRMEAIKKRFVRYENEEGQ